ncbi:ATP-dependent DNA helicase pif1 [Fusarium oxysporum f. sp. albedinis]|nr:ATP-dependent DNA helicase pif1 [Fusarium oxysporum f. sp. albedinis]
MLKRLGLSLLPSASSYSTWCISIMSRSQVSNPAAGPSKDLSRKPRPTAYSPDMDKPRVYSLARMREIDDWKNELFFTYRSISYNGVEVEMKTFFVKEYDEMEIFFDAIDDGNIHILKATAHTVHLFYTNDFREICQSLGFAPWISIESDYNVLRGLGRRVYDSHYDIWFNLPIANLRMGDDYDPVIEYNQELPTLTFETELGTSHMFADSAFFYLSLNTESKQARIVYSSTIPADERIIAISESSRNLGLRDDPFSFLTCALSSILQDQGANAHPFSTAISEMEHYSNSLRYEIVEGEETKVKETAIQLKICLPYMEKILEFVECMIQIIEDTISEHRECRDLLPIPQHHYFRVKKNLQTLRSQAISFKSYQETRIRRVNICLSTAFLTKLSSMLSLRTDCAIKASTEAMTRLTKANREDSIRMNEIGVAMKLDSEAMITIAKLTMFYLPLTFVATIFSMGIFNFDFENGKNGRLVMSSQWWLYIIFAIPLTLGTFYWFRAVTRSHKQASQKAEREAKQPE